MIIKITSFGDSQVDVLFELYSIVCLSLTQCDRDRESVSSFAAIKSWGQIGRRDRQQETRTSGVLEASAKATGRESGRWPSYQRQEARGPLFTTSQFQTERFLLTKIRQILILIIDPGFQCQLPWLCTSTSGWVGGWLNKSVLWRLLACALFVLWIKHTITHFQWRSMSFHEIGLCWSKLVLL